MDALTVPIEPLSATDDIIAFIYRGPLEEPVPWRGFLRELRQRMQCDAVALMLRPSSSDSAPIFYWDAPYEVGSAEIEAVVAARMQVADEHVFSQVLRASGDIATLSELVARDQFIQSDYYLRFFQPLGIEHVLTMCFLDTDSWTCYLILANGVERPDFGAVEKTFLLDCLPHLEQALKGFARLQIQAQQKEIYRHTLDQLTIGAIMLDGHGRVIEVNRAASELLQNNVCLALKGDLLELPPAAPGSAALRKLVDAALAWRGGRHAEAFVEVLWLENPGGPSLSVLVRAVPASGVYPLEVGPRVIIYCSDPQQRASAPDKIVAQMFGLTRSEAQVALLLANGVTLTEAAAQLQLSESSVRTYSKRLFEKTGVSRQPELVRLILKSTVLLAGPGS